MSSTTRKKSIRSISKAEKGAAEGRQYEEILFLALSTRAYELSRQENPMFREFVICREVKMGKYRKIDDIVLSYTDQDNSKKLIFVQLKHKQDYKVIDSRILSTEAARAKNIKGPHGYMCETFNLQQYFISYLSVRDELEHTNTKELKDGKIKYVVLFTNMGLNCEELQEKKFVFKKAPDDIANIFTLQKSASETQHSSQCYQFGNVSDDLREILKKSSDLERIARELAQYVLCKNQRKVMGFIGTPLEHYHSWLKKHVIKISLDKVYTIRLTGKRKKNKQKFRKAEFKDKFLDCDQTASNLHQLREALFEAIRDIDRSKKGVNDYDLKAAKWKIVPNFGQSEQNIKTDLPCERISVSDEDITEFLQHFVFIVNQPGVNEIELLYKHSIQGVVAENTSLKKLQDHTYAAGEEFKKHVEECASTKRNNDEKWISSGPIEKIFEEKSQRVGITYDVSALTRMYKKEVMQYGKFNDVGKKLENIDSFLSSDCKILCVNTPVTLFSSIKLLQHLDTKNDLISVSLNILNNTENRDSVLKAFELENISLLTMECTHAFKDHDIIFLRELVNIARKNSNKKIILIMQQENSDICTKHFKTDFQDEGICVIENDSIELKDFKPKDNPLAKKVLVFQGQKEKISFSDIMGIDSWPSYVRSLSQGTNEHALIGEMTLGEILSNDEIKVGSKIAGTSSLEGAYAQMCEEINVENLVDRLKSQEHGNDTNDMYIISGIKGSSKEDKTDKLIQYLGEDNKNGEFKNPLKTFSVHILDDDLFNNEDFNKFCPDYPEKRIFWISLEYEINATKFVLQGIYNPEFYLKRKFKNVIIKKDLKQQLIKDNLPEIFIFHCAEDKQLLYKFMELNAREMEQIENSSLIKIFSLMKDAEDDFKKRSKQSITVHLIEFEEKQFIWRDSHGSLSNLLNHIDKEEVKLIEEDNFIRKIKDRKVVIFADDPGMGKTTTQIKLYETESESSSIIKSHWVIGIKLRDHLDAVRVLEFKKDAIDIASLVKFLLKIDSKLNNNLATNLLKIVLDKSKSFQAKPLLLIFDGFDEVLDEVYRNRILMLLQFIKDKTAAKLWITTRCHFKNLLEETLSTIAIQFSPMDYAENAQYIATYLQHRLYLTLNKDDTVDEKQKIDMYTAAFVNKMKSFFRGDISKFIGTPLQLYLMLEYTVRDFKNWIKGGDSQISVFNDVCELYEYFINRKYDVYFQKRGYREREQQGLDKCTIDGYHKEFAVSKILKEDANNDFKRYKHIFLLVGVIKSQGTDLEFIHKTFEEFFAAKVFIDWIKKVRDTKEQEYLLTEIFMKPDYQLVRTFMNLQLQKLSERARKDERPNELDKSLEHCGTVAAKLLRQEKSPLIDVNGTPLHIAVKENNKHIALFLLNSLKGHSDALRKLLFAVGEYSTRKNARSKGTALHLACWRDDVEMVKVLLDAAEGISEDTLQGFLRCLNEYKDTALVAAAKKSHNSQCFNELLSRANNKLDLILTEGSALCTACLHEKEEFAMFYFTNLSMKKILSKYYYYIRVYLAMIYIMLQSVLISSKS